MIALIVIGEAKEGLQEEAKKWFQEKLPPIMKKAKGFNSYLNLLDPKTNKIVTVTVWESDAEAIAFRNSPVAQEVLAECFQLFYNGGPNMERFEVQTAF